MRPEVERVYPQNLEINLADRFKNLIKDIHRIAVEETDSLAQAESASILRVYTDGVHLSDLDCPSHGSEEIFRVEESATGDTVIAQWTGYERFPDETVDITGGADGIIRIENGVLVEVSNPEVLRMGTRKLQLIRNGLVDSITTETDRARELHQNAMKLMEDLTGRYDGSDVQLDMKDVDSGEVKKGVVFIREDNIIIWAEGGIQNELFFSTDNNSFECFQCLYASEKPKLLQAGVVTDTEFDNLDYVANCVSQLRDLREFMEQRALRRALLERPKIPIQDSIVSHQKSFDLSSA